MSLDIAPYRESGTFVLKGFDEVQVLLDDHIVMTQAMAFSPFKGPFAQRIEDWEKVRGILNHQRPNIELFAWFCLHCLFFTICFSASKGFRDLRNSMWVSIGRNVCI